MLLCSHAYSAIAWLMVGVPPPIGHPRFAGYTTISGWALQIETFTVQCVLTFIHFVIGAVHLSKVSGRNSGSAVTGTNSEQQQQHRSFQL